MGHIKDITLILMGPMSEVVWDILVFLEATKVYKKLMKNKELDQKMIDKLDSVNNIQNQTKMLSQNIWKR